MSQIFISYARSTEREARSIADSLRALGFAVWRDDELPAHRDYSDVIEERLKASKAVLVIWSAEAAKSQWVRAEADVAREAGKLVQLNLDAAALPMPFNRIQCADLSSWKGDDSHAGWRKVVDSVAELCGKAAETGTPTRPAAPRTQSICVLPFANISDDPQQEYFSDGISEDIITDLSKVSALEVTARNTAFTFKGKSVEVPEIASRLKVSHVLEGSVRKAGNRVRITAQLIDGASGNHLWAERWDRTLDDIFALQDEISEAIVSALKIKLLPEEKKAIEQRGTDNVEAYNLYLMARRHYLTQSGKRLDLVVRLCQGAVDLDPDYAHAWALMARAKASRTESFFADRGGDGGWVEAERALALDANLAEAHATKAKLLSNEGQFAAAQAEIDIALALDPRSSDVNRTAGECALTGRRFGEAIRYFEAAAETNEEDGSSHFMAIQCYEGLGDAEGARAAARRTLERVEKSLAREPDNGSHLAIGVTALARLGEVDRAREWAKHALLMDPNDGRLRYNLACAMTRLGDSGLALEYLENALDLGGPSLVLWVKEDSDFDGLRDDSRFQALLNKAEARLAQAT